MCTIISRLAYFPIAARGAGLFIVGLGLAACEGPTGPEGPVGELVMGRVYASSGFSCGIVGEGRGLCWGINDEGQIGVGVSVATFAAGPREISDRLVFRQLTTKAAGRHVCGLTSSNETLCWGENDFGQLGFGEIGQRVGLGLVTGGQIFTSISAGWRSSCGVTDEDDAYCWGRGVWGQLGDGLATLSPVPVPVAGGHKFQKVEVGSSNLVCGLTTGGSILCWGLDRAGALGSHSATLCNSSGGLQLTCGTVPQPIDSGERFVELSTGSSFACGVTQSFEAFCWGRNDFGQLGRPITETCAQAGLRTLPCARPGPVSGPHRFVMVSAGLRHACGVTVDGDAYCWGRNSIGEVGTGVVGGSYDVPKLVRGGVTFRAVSAGDQHTCGEGTDGELYCWGSNAWGAARHRRPPSVAGTDSCAHRSLWLRLTRAAGVTQPAATPPDSTLVARTAGPRQAVSAASVSTSHDRNQSSGAPVRPPAGPARHAPGRSGREGGNDSWMTCRPLSAGTLRLLR